MLYQYIKRMLSSHGKVIINFRGNSCLFLLLIGSKTANQNQKKFESLLTCTMLVPGTQHSDLIFPYIINNPSIKNSV